RTGSDIKGCLRGAFRVWKIPCPPKENSFIVSEEFPAPQAQGICCKSLEAPCKVIRGRIWAEFEKIPAKSAAIRESREQTERQPQSWCLSDREFAKRPCIYSTKRKSTFAPAMAGPVACRFDVRSLSSSAVPMAATVGVGATWSPSASMVSTP